MKKLTISIALGTLLFASPFREAFISIKKADRIVISNPQKANMLYIKAYDILSNIMHKDLKNKKPSPNVLYLLGKLYLEGKGVSKNYKKARNYLCYASQIGNARAGSLLTKHNITCPTNITIKELEQ